MRCKSTDFLDLSNKILSRGSLLRFQAKGYSMHPFIKNGDILTVKGIAPFEIKIGDPVFFRLSQGAVKIHRVIKIRRIKGEKVFLTKGDAVSHPDQYVSGKEIQGKVITIEREGKIITLEKTTTNVINLLCAKLSPFSRYIYPPGRKLKRYIRRMLGKLLPYIQGLKLYRKLGRKLIKDKICYSIAFPDDAFSLCRLYRYNERPDIRNHIESFRQGLDKPDDSKYRLIAKRGGKVVGSVTLKRTSKTDSSPYKGWWLFGTLVEWPYRGLGIGKKLTKMACEIAAENDALKVRLLAFERAKPAINLYRNMGFRQILIPDIDAQLEDEVKRGLRRRIIMEKVL